MTNKEEMALLNSVVHAMVTNDDGPRVEKQFIDLRPGDGFAVTMAKAWCLTMVNRGEWATISDSQGYLVKMLSRDRRWF